MPKTQFKRYIRNVLIQEVSEGNEDIDLLDLNKYALKSEI